MRLVRTMQNQLMSINKASSTTSSMEMTWTTNKKVACKHSTQVEGVIDKEVTQYTSRLMKKQCNERLMI